VTRSLVAAALCLSLVVSGAAASAETDGILSGYSLTSWHDGAGRPLGSVYAVVQSNDGYLWLGSDAGLMRFDGWRFFTWDDLSDTAIPGSRMKKIWNLTEMTSPNSRVRHCRAVRAIKGASRDETSKNSGGKLRRHS